MFLIIYCIYSNHRHLTSERSITEHRNAEYINCPLPPSVQGSRRDQKIKRSRGGRWSWTFKLAQKRSGVGRWSWAAKIGLFSLRVVAQQQCNGDYPCDSALAQQLKQQLRSAQVAGQWRGDTALTLPLFWRRSTVSPVFFGRYPRSSLHCFVPPPPPPPSPSLISHLASVDVKQNGPPSVRLGLFQPRGAVCVHPSIPALQTRDLPISGGVNIAGKVCSQRSFLSKKKI